MGGGHFKLKNAFTLIELLAIIVILAIIAVITVPIILNVIDNAKKGSVIDSAYGYKDAVQKFYVSKLYEDANFKFENGTYTVETLKTMGVSVDGTSPTDDSWVEITNNQVSDYSLKFDEWVVNYDKDTNQPVATKGDVSLPPIQQILANIPKTLKDDGRKYFDSTWINVHPIYFNPQTNGGICTEQEYTANEDKLGNTGCMKWYAYSENADGTINMLLDHNTTNGIDWTTKDDYEGLDLTLMSSLGLSYPNLVTESNPLGINGDDSFNIGYAYGNVNKGPITLLKKLQDDTKNWNNNIIKSQSHGTYTTSDYTIDYTIYNARLMGLEEIENITNIYAIGEPLSTDCFNTKEEYAWLRGGRAFWTVTPFNSYMIYVVYSSGFFTHSGYAFTARSYGLHPIITVSNSVLVGS